MTTIWFGIVAAVTLLSGVFVVRTQNLIHAVMWLALSLLGTAALYAILDAPFLSGVQVLTYVGGVVTLMIFGVMITRRHDGSRIEAGSVKSLRGAAAAIALFAVICFAVALTDFPAVEPPPPAPTTKDLARSLLDDNLFAFEVASLLLLAAIVGSVVLARRRDSEPDARGGVDALNELPGGKP